MQPAVGHERPLVAQAPLRDREGAPAVDGVVLRQHGDGARSGAVDRRPHHDGHVAVRSGRRPHRHDVTGLGSDSHGAVRDFDQPTAVEVGVVVRDDVCAVGLERTRAVDLSHEALGQLDALPLRLTPAGAAPDHVGGSIDERSRSAHRDAEIGRAEGVRSNAGPSELAGHRLPVVGVAVALPPGSRSVVERAGRGSGRRSRGRRDRGTGGRRDGRHRRAEECGEHGEHGDQCGRRGEAPAGRGVGVHVVGSSRGSRGRRGGCDPCDIGRCGRLL